MPRHLPSLPKFGSKESHQAPMSFWTEWSSLAQQEYDQRDVLLRACMSGKGVDTPCLPKVPRGRTRSSRATTRERIPHRAGGGGRPSQGTSRPTGNTSENTLNPFHLELP
ncbi:hypothetical protein Ccrd_002023 [Cynara cardunculus var. scolymus]|uniref:Uncharacterized protein n=1 Tax=Cynara cardunculus var. scolymus TaxID=59895 RepID=A0A103XS59_CYNCS|nr:hypothetical protein Ccrd_002023 [Cynara cardunculus var. scolymus]